MREIKFRAWDGVSLMYSDGNFDSLASFFGHYHEQFFFDDAKCGEPTDIIFQQFTGLKDKSGKDIYEGDICEGHSDGIGIITWTDFDGGYDYIFSDDANVGIWEVSKDIKIIGNIYENQELLNHTTNGHSQKDL